MGKEESARLTDKGLCEDGLSIPARMRYGEDGVPHWFLQCGEIREVGDQVKVENVADQSKMKRIKTPAEVMPSIKGYE